MTDKMNLAKKLGLLVPGLVVTSSIAAYFSDKDFADALQPNCIGTTYHVHEGSFPTVVGKDYVVVNPENCEGYKLKHGSIHARDRNSDGVLDEITAPLNPHSPLFSHSNLQEMQFVFDKYQGDREWMLNQMLYTK